MKRTRPKCKEEGFEISEYGPNTKRNVLSGCRVGPFWKEMRSLLEFKFVCWFLIFMPLTPDMCEVILVAI